MAIEKHPQFDSVFPSIHLISKVIFTLIYSVSFLRELKILYELMASPAIFTADTPKLTMRPHIRQRPSELDFHCNLGGSAD